MIVYKKYSINYPRAQFRVNKPCLNGCQDRRNVIDGAPLILRWVDAPILWGFDVEIPSHLGYIQMGTV